MISPSIRFLTQPTIERVVAEAIEALADPGVEVHSAEGAIETIETGMTEDCGCFLKD